MVNFVDITGMKVLDRLKSEFVAKVSHELRSPLSTIHEQLAVVIRELMDSQSGQEHQMLTRAKEKTRGLISLIGDLLDLSRIEEASSAASPSQWRWTNCCEHRGLPEGPGQGEKQDLSISLPQDPLPKIDADPIALESIFGNLIANAIKYTPEEGKVRVEADRAGVNIRVRVIDNGYGMAEKHLEKIFERFYRVKDDNTRYINGTGLGLPIVKGLLDSMGGIVEVESTPGEGSVFTVLLPTKG